MFKNKYLKQLQDVQKKIKKCKASIASLAPPEPDSSNMGWDLYNWFSALFHQCRPDISELYRMEFTGFNDSKSEYLRKLGEYFINISDYYKNKKKYSIELEHLLQEERRLKEKLGIN